jgi:hypothetical protein
VLPLIKKYNTIENIIDEYIKPNKKLVEKHRYSPEFLQQAIVARDMFYTDHHIGEYMEQNQQFLEQLKEFKWTVPDNIRDTFCEFLCGCDMTPHGTTRWADQITGKLDVLPTSNPNPTPKRTVSAPAVPKVDVSAKKPANQLSIKDFFSSTPVSSVSSPSIVNETGSTKKTKIDNNKNGCLL